MKVVFIIGSFGWSFPARVKALKQKLEKEGHTLFVMELFSGYSDYQQLPSQERFGLPIETVIKDVRSADINNREAFNMLIKRFDQICPDVILGGPIQFTYGAAALKWTKKNGKAFVGFDDAKFDTFERNPIVTKARSILIASADAMLLPTHDWDESAKKWGLKPEQLFYGYSVVDNQYWQQKVQNPLKDQLPPQYFINIVRQVGKKNLERLVMAHNAYINKGGKIPLVLIGSGPCHEKLVKLAKDNNKIIFLPEQKDLRGFYINARFMFLPSNKEETWGFTTNEAMASGVPCCVSRECGSSSLIEDGNNGFLYHFDSEEEIESTFFRAENISDQVYQTMKARALSSISKWDLDRFVEGAYRACTYAIGHKRRLSLLAKIILIYWKGH